MALTMRRWILIALVGAAILPVILLRRVEPREPERSAVRERLAITAARARGRELRLAEALHLARLRDSVAASLPRSGAGRMIVDPRLPQQTSAAIAILQANAARGRPAQPRGAVDVVFVLDTATRFRGHQLRQTNNKLVIDHFAPADASGRCLVLARINPTAFWGNFISTDAGERFMGPCAFYEHYGAPGAGIKRWLDARSWLLAQYGPQGVAGAGGWVRSFRWAVDMRGWISGAGFRCLMGNDSSCVTAVLERGVYERRLDAISGASMPPQHERDFHSVWNLSERAGGLGPRQPAMLGDMARSLGDEKFLAFWRSSREPMDAFREASGRDFPSWAQEWMAGHYPPQETGPTTTPGAKLFALVILIAGVGLAMLAADRRQAV